MAALLSQLGTLRLLLLAATLAVSACGPFVDASVHIDDWRILPSVVAPSVMMMLLFTLPLDMTMSRVFMSDADAAERARLAAIIKLEAAAMALLVLCWLPFMIEVLDFSPLS